MINSLYAAGTTTVSIDIREDGTITGINWSQINSSPVEGQWELSFNSAPSFTTNDTTGVLGGGPVAALANEVIHDTGFIPFSEAVQAGERLFLHQSGLGVKTRAFISSDIKGGRRNVRRA
jgi:hypothetical protein